MKYVVQTQIRENYGAHDWDSHKGVCPQYWKYKGGNTYVFPDVSIAVASNKDDAFYSIIKNNLTSADDYYEEYIVGEELIDDSDTAPICEDWETPIICNIVNGAIHCTTDSVPQHLEDARKKETFVMLKGVKEDYTLRYHLFDGRVLDWKGGEICLAA
tara:strand:- start:661 stop:1134 length:474 start_codon:yes stop_codon:yes gene_type:complete